MSIEVMCDDCGEAAKLVRGAMIYPHLPKLANKWYWLCVPCGAYVGCHENSRDHKPLGRLANAELRSWKIRAHAVFDPLWKGDSATMTRKEAYRHLQVLLQMDRQPHMGFMSLEECKRVVELLGPKSPAPVAVSL